MSWIPTGIILVKKVSATRRLAIHFACATSIAALVSAFVALSQVAALAEPLQPQSAKTISELILKIEAADGYALAKTAPSENRADAGLLFRTTLHEGERKQGEADVAAEPDAKSVKAEVLSLSVSSAVSSDLPHFIKAMSRIRLGTMALNDKAGQRGAHSSTHGVSDSSRLAGDRIKRRAPLLTLSPLPVIEPADDETVVAVLPAQNPAIRGSVTELATPSETAVLPIDMQTTASLPTGNILPSLSDAKSELADKKMASLLKQDRPRPLKSVISRNGFRLADAVASAVMTYPEIRINEARLREAGAGIDVSRAAFYPTGDLRLAAGGNFSGSYEGRPIPYAKASNAADNRFDGGVVLRQLLFDFGAARSDVQRAEFLRDAEKQKLKEKVDEIAYKTSQTFLKVLEQRSLLGLIDETIRSHEHLARVVQAHAREGHGTLADVSRVNSRLIDVRAIRSDISLQLMAAEDQFQRFTRKKPGALADIPEFGKIIPNAPANAIQQAIANNPRLGALQASRRSAEKELESQRSSALPKINLEIDSEAKNFRNHSLGRTQIEGRAMVAMRYRFMDGGLSSANHQQIMARIEGSEMSYLNEREQMEADIRQAYRAIESSGRKSRLVAEGVASSDKVRELYLEQFKGGKRSIFELLDGQMSYYTARRSQIESQYEGRRAMFDILRSMGDLTRALSQRG